MAHSSAKKYVYSFGSGKADGSAKDKNLLGGKGANLAEMCLLGMPVPAGFSISTDCCVEYFSAGMASASETISFSTPVRC